MMYILSMVHTDSDNEHS